MNVDRTDGNASYKTTSSRKAFTLGLAGMDVGHGYKLGIVNARGKLVRIWTPSFTLRLAFLFINSL